MRQEEEKDRPAQLRRASSCSRLPDTLELRSSRANSLECEKHFEKLVRGSISSPSCRSEGAYLHVHVGRGWDLLREKWSHASNPAYYVVVCFGSGLDIVTRSLPRTYKKDCKFEFDVVGPLDVDGDDEEDPAVTLTVMERDAFKRAVVGSVTVNRSLLSKRQGHKVCRTLGLSKSHPHGGGVKRVETQEAAFAGQLYVEFTWQHYYDTTHEHTSPCQHLSIPQPPPPPALPSLYCLSRKSRGGTFIRGLVDQAFSPFRTWKIRLWNVNAIFPPPFQCQWNQAYDAAQKIYGPGPGPAALRQAMHMQHALLHQDSDVYFHRLSCQEYTLHGMHEFYNVLTNNASTSSSSNSFSLSNLSLSSSRSVSPPPSLKPISPLSSPSASYDEDGDEDSTQSNSKHSTGYSPPSLSWRRKPKLNHSNTINNNHHQNKPKSYRYTYVILRTDSVQNDPTTDQNHQNQHHHQTLGTAGLMMSRGPCMKFSRTSAKTGMDLLSKHALHANAAESVVYSGEFFFDTQSEEIIKQQQQQQQQQEEKEVNGGRFRARLVIDNNSGTFAPPKEELWRLKRLCEVNFGMEWEVLALDRGDPLLKHLAEVNHVK